MLRSAAVSVQLQATWPLCRSMFTDRPLPLQQHFMRVVIHEMQPGTMQRTR
jgi:hypothetical protein